MHKRTVWSAASFFTKFEIVIWQLQSSHLAQGLWKMTPSRLMYGSIRYTALSQIYLSIKMVSASALESHKLWCTWKRSTGNNNNNLDCSTHNIRGYLAFHGSEHFRNRDREEARGIKRELATIGVQYHTNWEHKRLSRFRLSS